MTRTSLTEYRMVFAQHCNKRFINGVVACGLISCLLALSPAHAQQGFASQAEFFAARLLASQCAQCHGTNGHPVGDIDGLAGMPEAEMLDELYEMMIGRPDDIMDHQVFGYTTEQLDLMAQYYSMVPGNNGNDEEDEPDEEDKPDEPDEEDKPDEPDEEDKPDEVDESDEKE